MPKTYIVGNWKMNQGLEEVKSFFKELKDYNLPQGNFWIAPQYIHIHLALELTKDSVFKIGSQNCSDQDQGAFTGEVSLDSLKEIGTHFTLIGHSERRAYYDEDDAFINRKVKRALEVGVTPILCVGESLAERESGKTLDIVLSQLTDGLKDVHPKSEDKLIIAYEPVWAIGTGKTATPEQAQEVHKGIRGRLQEMYGDLGKKLSILYGGSIKPSNIGELLQESDINGGLVGGASLKASDFSQLCKASS